MVHWRGGREVRRLPWLFIFGVTAVSKKTSRPSQQKRRARLKKVSPPSQKSILSLITNHVFYFVMQSMHHAMELTATSIAAVMVERILYGCLNDREKLLQEVPRSRDLNKPERQTCQKDLHPLADCDEAQCRWEKNHKGCSGCQSDIQCHCNDQADSHCGN